MRSSTLKRQGNWHYLSCWCHAAKNQAKGRGGVLFVCKLFPSINVTCQVVEFLVVVYKSIASQEKKCHFRSSYVVQPFQSSPDQKKKVGSKSTYRVPKKVHCFWQVHTTIVQTFPLFAEFRCKPKNWLFFKLVIWNRRYYAICFACCTQEKV